MPRIDPVAAFPARRVPSLALLLLFPVLVAGCGGGDDATSPSPSPPPLVEATVGPDGGALVHADIVVEVPPGALASAADLAVYGGAPAPVFPRKGEAAYRITGLPAALNRPVRVRFRGGPAGADGPRLLWRGEWREGYDGGDGWAWQAVAGSDSAGWHLVRLTRGPLWSAKEDAGVAVAAADSVVVTLSATGSFRLFHLPGRVPADRAETALAILDGGLQMFRDWGFAALPDTGIWPLDVAARTPPGGTIACYVSAPGGRGFFLVDPAVLASQIDLAPILIHELFHAVQTFYDPRDPDAWGTLDRERLWLDEATAAWLESATVDDPSYHPGGMNDDNAAAPLCGLTVCSGMGAATYGYGMAGFVRYLVEESGACPDGDCLPALFARYAETGSVNAALAAELQPAVAQWCTGLQRRLLSPGLYPGLDPWWSWTVTGDIPTALGESRTATADIPDLGAALLCFTVPAPTKRRLVVTAHDDAGERIPLAAYGYRQGTSPGLLGAGTDSLVLETDGLAAGDALLVLASRPYGAAPAYNGSSRCTITLAAAVAPGTVDLAAIDRVSIEVTVDGDYAPGGLLLNQLIGVSGAVAWDGAGWSGVAGDDTFRIALDAATLALGDWSGHIHGTTVGGSDVVRRLAGHGIPLTTVATDQLVYRTEGAAACAALTEVFESLATAPGEPPYRVLTGYSCHDGEGAGDGSRVYIHLYRLQR